MEQPTDYLRPKDLNATGRFSSEDECIQGKEMEINPSKFATIEIRKQQLSILQSRYTF